jgi:ankyrin repeat protein
MREDIPFIEAVADNDIETVRRMLAENPYRVDVQSHDDMPRRIGAKASPLMIAAMRGYTEIARLLIAYGADVNDTISEQPDIRYRPDHRSALHSASANGYPEIVSLLLAAGADVNGHPECVIGTPICVAVWQMDWVQDPANLLACIYLLMQAGANPYALAGTKESAVSRARAGRGTRFRQALHMMGTQ